MKNILAIFCLAVIISCDRSEEKPTLVVGIVVDQMRMEYLHRFYDDFSENGFKRLIKDGYLFKNAHYNFIPTQTGPGHASIFTGTTPSKHGIIGNEWYVESLGRNVNCVEDTTEIGVGGTLEVGNVSTRNLKTTTITDELRLFYNFRSKVVSISFKDRSAALPSGHNPTGAYWYDSNTGNMMTSSYFMDELPSWVRNFNELKRADILTNQPWDYFINKENYTESIADSNRFEIEGWRGLGTTFPYDLSAAKDNSGVLRYSPFASTFLREFAQEAVLGEELGQDNFPDFLTIGFSATDDLGHRFGPRSKEVQDIYLRLDYEISQLLEFLDKNVGINKYTVFITSDHGVADVPSYSVSKKMPGGYLNTGYIKSILNEALIKEYGNGIWVIKVMNDQVFLNKKLIDSKKLDLEKIQLLTAKVLLKEDFINEVLTATQLAQRNLTDPIALMLQNGYNKISGDVLYVFNSGYLNDNWGEKGTDHRTGYTYDTHIPILFYGNSIKSGTSSRKVAITDIAPTISMLLSISLPSGCTGNPLIEILE